MHFTLQHYFETAGRQIQCSTARSVLCRARKQIFDPRNENGGGQRRRLRDWNPAQLSPEAAARSQPFLEPAIEQPATGKITMEYVTSVHMTFRTNTVRTHVPVTL